MRTHDKCVQCWLECEISNVSNSSNYASHKNNIVCNYYQQIRSSMDEVCTLHTHSQVVI